jgi:hypothetical protein
MSEEIKNGILNKSLFYILGGRIDYDDEFGNPHVSTFCVVYEHNPAYPDSPDAYSTCRTKDLNN